MSGGKHHKVCCYFITECTIYKGDGGACCGDVQKLRWHKTLLLCKGWKFPLRLNTHDVCKVIKKCLNKVQVLYSQAAFTQQLNDTGSHMTITGL